MDLLQPQAGPFGLSVTVTGVDGKPVESGWAEIRLDAPKPGLFFSTDIQQVEGTRLFEMRLPVQNGKVAWQYLWPIRGEYRLVVAVSDTAGQTASKGFPITVGESAVKWLTLSGVCVGLFLFGVIAGRVFTVPTAVAGSVVLAQILSGTELYSAASQVSQTRATAAPAALIIEPALVGKPSRIVWRLQNSANMTAPEATLTLAIKQLEDNHTVFKIEKIPVAGEFALNFQFTDGSEHAVTAVAERPGQSPVRVEQRVSVTAVEPAGAAALPAVTLFLGVMAFGLGVGRWSKLRGATRC